MPVSFNWNAVSTFFLQFFHEFAFNDAPKTCCLKALGFGGMLSIDHPPWVNNAYIVRVSFDDREGDTTLLSLYHFYLFQLIYFFFSYINDFLMVYNQSAFRILSLIALETITNQREEKQEIWLRDNKMFLNSDQFFVSLSILCQLFDKFLPLLKMWHTKQIWSILLQCRHTTDNVWHVSIVALGFIVQQGGDPELQGPEKVLFHVTKTWSYSEMPLTHKIWKNNNYLKPWTNCRIQHMKPNLVVLVFYDSLVEKTNCQNTAAFRVVTPYCKKWWIVFQWARSSRLLFLKVL